MSSWFGILRLGPDNKQLFFCITLESCAFVLLYSKLSKKRGIVQVRGDP